VAEAELAEQAGADAIIAQGMEAGGHRGAFEAERAEAGMVGLFALLPAICDAVRVPVIASGGIADARGVAAALMLGASAVQIGTGFLRCPEANIPTAWADAIGRTRPEDTVVTRAFSGRAGRSIATSYARAAGAPGAPRPAPYPVQRGLTRGMREQAARNNEISGMQAWAGQSAQLAQARAAAEVVRDVWDGARALLSAQ
jgi:nitronate monooxygenase